MSSSRLRAKPLIIGLVAAFVTGIALWLQVRNWQAVGSEAGGECHNDGCPRGSTLMLVLSFFALFVAVPAAGALFMVMKARWALAVAAGMVVLGALPGQLIFGSLHGDNLETVWMAARERPSTVQGEGSWLHGDTVVRARFDQVSGYDLATGDVRWVYRVPNPQVLCTMSRATDAGVGLVGYGEENGPCRRLVAVDLSNGRALWDLDLVAGVPKRSTALTADHDFPSRKAPDMVAAVGGVAAAASAYDLQGYGLRDGKQRWRRPAAENCRYADVIGGSGGLVVEVACPNAPPALRAVDPATGRALWETRVPIQGTSANLTLLSAKPPTVYVQAGGQRGVSTVVSFGNEGRPRAAIAIDDGHRRLDFSDKGFEAAPFRPLMVQGDRLVAIASKDRGDTDVQAYDLTNGRLLWSTEINSIEAVQTESDRVLVLSDGPIAPDLQAVSLRDGRPTYLGVTPFRWLTSEITMYSHNGRYVFVSEDSTAEDTFPVAVIR